MYSKSELIGLYRKRERARKILMDTLLQQKKKEEFTLVSTDESFFFYDSLVVRKVWIIKDERLVVKITGSNQESVLFGAISLEGK